MGFKVESKGLLTLIQGGPRIGYQQYGVSVSGAMDSYSHRLGNILVGNKEDEASLEILIMGPTIVFDKSTKIAVTGGNLSPQLNYTDIQMYKSYKVNKGDILSFGAMKEGCRAYVAFEGGIDVPLVMGSKSTYTKAKIGGFKGRALQEGDYVNLFDCKDDNICILEDRYIPKYNKDIVIRVTKGPQDDMFLEEEWEKFVSSEYIITNECDRMGYRLEGEAINHINGADIVSDGIAFGAIQVPGHGKPIIMMADRQSIGGYTKIANVISVDLPNLAQCKPGDKVKFKEVDIYKAHELLRIQESKIKDIKDTLINQTVVKNRYMSVTIDGMVFNTIVEEFKS